MKKLRLALLFFVVSLQASFAQPNSPTYDERVPKIILGTDFGFQWFSVLTRFSSLKVEIPLNTYQHLCLHFSKILSGSSYGYSFDYGYGQTIENGSFEVGLAGKFFPHGKFTGKKSGFYFGPDLRLGTRKFSALEYDFQNNSYKKTDFKHLTAKIMFNWGVQWRFGKHVVFDLGAPIGVEYYQTRDPRLTNNNAYSSRDLVMLPSIMMGFAF